MNYIEEIADEIAMEMGEPAPGQNRRDLFVLYALLALVKGQVVTKRNVHDAWVVWMDLQGEHFHHAMVPFDKLSAEAQASDEPYVEAIRRAAARVVRP